MIGFDQALAITLDAIAPLAAESLPLAQLVGRVLAGDAVAMVNSPPGDVSLKDGYAVRSPDLVSASPARPVFLTVVGVAAAGHAAGETVVPGAAVRVLTGAPLPQGADAVLADEFARREADTVAALAAVAPGRDIAPRGLDVTAGAVIARAGRPLRPAQVGLLAAAGLQDAPVLLRPQVAILATGDEVIAPGSAPRSGQLFASNLVTLQAWCHHEGFPTRTAVVADSRDELRRALCDALAESDAILTIGGAWKGDRDLVAHVLDELGWRKLYHRVRLGPGKAVGFGLWEGKPVFVLPGGPPSNLMAFLQLALPGLRRLAGNTDTGLPLKACLLGAAVSGQADWTQFVEGRFGQGPSGPVFHPQRLASRLQSMADCEGYVKIAEGVTELPEGTLVQAQVLPFVTED